MPTITRRAIMRQREDLRRDEQQLEQLRQRRNREFRQGDQDDAREYNEKIHNQKREIRQDRKNIYGDRDGGHGDGHDRDKGHRD